MRKNQVFELGYSHAMGIPENNIHDAMKAAAEADLTWEDNQDEISEHYYSNCHSAEENSRQFSPFEFTARDLNKLRDTASFDPWEIFDNGINKYFQEYWRANGKKVFNEARQEYLESQLEDTELQALQLAKSKMGQQWKYNVLRLWEGDKGTAYVVLTTDIHALLQSVRNKIGPSGLYFLDKAGVI